MTAKTKSSEPSSRKEMDRKEQAQDTSKNIEKGIRDKSSKRHEKVQNFLEELKRMKSIANIKTRKKNILITRMRNEAGDIEASRKILVTHFQNSMKICTQVGTIKEKLRRTTTEDLRTVATELTMMRILETMNKIITFQNLPRKHCFFFDWQSQERTIGRQQRNQSGRSPRS